LSWNPLSCLRHFVVFLNSYRQTLGEYVKENNFLLPFFPLALQPTFGPWPTSIKLSVSLQFTRAWTFGRTPWTGDQLVARPLPVHKHRKTHIHKH
jgi:hypothetical protein